jgi:hypothetical protein
MNWRRRLSRPLKDKHGRELRTLYDARAYVIELEHDPEKWEPVFGKDHAQTRI